MRSCSSQNIQLIDTMKKQICTSINNRISSYLKFRNQLGKEKPLRNIKNNTKQKPLKLIITNQGKAVNKLTSSVSQSSIKQRAHHGRQKPIKCKNDLPSFENKILKNTKLNDLVVITKGSHSPLQNSILAKQDKLYNALLILKNQMKLNNVDLKGIVSSKSDVLCPQTHETLTQNITKSNLNPAIEEGNTNEEINLDLTEMEVILPPKINVSNCISITLKNTFNNDCNLKFSSVTPKIERSRQSRNNENLELSHKIIDSNCCEIYGNNFPLQTRALISRKSTQVNKIRELNSFKRHHSLNGISNSMRGILSKDLFNLRNKPVDIRQVRLTLHQLKLNNIKFEYQNDFKGNKSQIGLLNNIYSRELSNKRNNEEAKSSKANKISKKCNKFISTNYNFHNKRKRKIEIK